MYRSHKTRSFSNNKNDATIRDRVTLRESRTKINVFNINLNLINNTKVKYHTEREEDSIKPGKNKAIINLSLPEMDKQ